MEVTLDKFGRILLPKKLRDHLGLKPGSRLRVVASDEEIALHPTDTDPVLIDEDGVLVFQGEVVGDADDLLGSLREERIRALGGE
jgi:AbrB family looped-hinge helix DNA binding protein